MKTIQLIVNRVFVSSILLISMLFFIPPAFGIADGINVTFYLYLYGFPFRWVTIASNTESKSNFMNTFLGNDGVSIQLLNLIGSFLLIFLLVSIIFFLVKKLYRRKKEKN
ncbi:hypothetical protein EOT00_08745 [Listeria seeligeri]|uniref:hypothetical protein n=1 Tax=Listeria seeligeri TaxID=1640 RepID=UPI0011198DC6|nr:hypothetical protein [Listeria seeligeri]QDA75042.1 hypothetical protein EOT00_08745 [Listeria seeligeri]